MTPSPASPVFPGLADSSLARLKISLAALQAAIKPKSNQTTIICHSERSEESRF
jgi:hypothetical protein